MIMELCFLRRLYSICLFCFFLSLFIVTSAGHIDSPDGKESFLLAESMIKRQSLGLTQKTDTALRVESGVWYPVRGIGQALVMLPFYIIGERLFYTFGLNEGLKGYFMEGICSLSSALLSALLCFVFFLFLLGMGYSLKSSTITTFILGLATVIWPYSKSTFNQMLTALMLLTTLYTLYVFKINNFWNCN